MELSTENGPIQAIQPIQQIQQQLNQSMESVNNEEEVSLLLFTWFLKNERHVYRLKSIFYFLFCVSSLLFLK